MNSSGDGESSNSRDDRSGIATLPNAGSVTLLPRGVAVRGVAPPVSEVKEPFVDILDPG